MKKLDLTKAKAGQTIYFINDNILIDNNFKMWVEQIVVTNDPVPPEGEIFIKEGKVSRHSLALIAKQMETNRVPYIKASRKQAERATEDMMRLVKKHCNPEPIKPEESGKCPDCGKGELTYLAENCTCHINPPCGYCIDAPLTCNECGAEFVED